MHLPMSAMRALVRLHKGGSGPCSREMRQQSSKRLLVSIYLDGNKFVKATFRSHTTLTCVNVRPSKLIFPRTRHAGNQTYRPPKQGTQEKGSSRDLENTKATPAAILTRLAARHTQAGWNWTLAGSPLASTLRGNARARPAPKPV